MEENKNNIQNIFQLKVAAITGSIIFQKLPFFALLLHSSQIPKCQFQTERYSELFSGKTQVEFIVLKVL